jgi:dipeptidyl-peptidase-4
VIVQKKYPVLVHVYGGPGAQLVTSQFPTGSGSPGFHSYLSSSHNFIIFTVDPVGTGGLGDDYQKARTYGHLGVTEAEDVVGAVAWLKQKCFVSTDQIALWGWSYGGFMASRITSLGTRSGLAATIGVAPVTDWKLYDSIYTERYMRTPALNAEGYDNSSVLARTPIFSPLGPQFFLIHGTGDDNVHFQNSALLAERLVDSNPGYDFSSFYYPNRAHSLVGPNGETNQHLYRMLTRFLLQALRLPGTVQ